jgi:hypothetical protein
LKNTQQPLEGKEAWPRKCEAVSSNSSTAKKKRKKERKEGKKEERKKERKKKKRKKERELLEFFLLAYDASWIYYFMYLYYMSFAINRFINLIHVL